MNIFRKTVGWIYFAALSVSCRKYPEEEHTINANGLDLHYFIRGPKDGKSVVLLHGNGGSHKSMLTQAKQLAKAGYRVYSLDSRGQGANSPLDEYHYSDMAEDTFCFIKNLGLEHPAVYGWSDGGIIGLMLEMTHPGTCGLLSVSGANLCPDCGEGFEEFKQWIIEQNTPLTAMMLNEPDINPGDLSAIKCPTQVVVGDLDMISVDHTRQISDNIPASELVIVKNGTHSSFIKRNPRMGRMLLDFFSRHGY